jgi:hypothetical protein
MISYGLDGVRQDAFLQSVMKKNLAWGLLSGFHCMETKSRNAQGNANCSK